MAPPTVEGACARGRAKSGGRFCWERIIAALNWNSHPTGVRFPRVQAAAAPNQTRDLRNRRLSEDSVAVLQTFHRHVACGIVYLR